MSGKLNSVALSLLALFTAAPGLAQPGFDAFVTSPNRVWLSKLEAARSVARRFNEIGSHAVELRRAMTQEDAESFDAVMIDLMGALLALPSIGLGGPCGARLCPTAPLPDRISQLDPELRALDLFFRRLQRATKSPEDARLFASADQSVKRMLSSLPVILPTISATSLRAARQK